MSPATSSRPTSAPPHRATPGRVFGFWGAVTALVAGGLELVLAAWFFVQSATYEPPAGDDASLHGVGFVIAGVLAVPAGSGVVAALAVLLLRDRHATASLVLSVLALVATVPLAVVVALMGLG